jgi:hypothetical protein
VAVSSPATETMAAEAAASAKTATATGGTAKVVAAAEAAHHTATEAGVIVRSGWYRSALRLRKAPRRSALR